MGDEASFVQRLKNFTKRNIVLVVVIPMMVSVHWAWAQLQEVEQFVPKHERRELPIFKVCRVLWF